jgi:CRISPR-associated Csx2 family protein
MARKFISFLGAQAYEDTHYFFNNDPGVLAQATGYVQEAIFEIELNTWQPSDKVIIFTTEEAREKNYNNRATRNKETLEGQGLEHILERLQKKGLIGEYSAVTIPNGNSDMEIWEVFQSVFTHISEGDELYFDITYGFRSLPMLGIVLLDYARTLRNVSIKKLYYGNYEAGRANQKPGELVHAPVLDLTPFAQLQEWTSAAKIFLNGGNAEPLAALTEEQNPEISRNLRLFAPAILTCRGWQLAEGIDISSFRKLVDSSLASPIAAQLRPLLEKTQEKLEPFESNNLHNGLHAVKWCIDNGLVQQGYTFLQETIVSLVLEKVFTKKYLTDTDYRADTGTALNGKNPAMPGLRLKTDMDNYRLVFDYVKSQQGLSRLYKKLTGNDGLRNDINHCGFNGNYATPQRLNEELVSLYQQFCQIKLS